MPLQKNILFSPPSEGRSLPAFGVGVGWDEFGCAGMDDSMPLFYPHFFNCKKNKYNFHINMSRCGS